MNFWIISIIKSVCILRLHSYKTNAYTKIEEKNCDIIDHIVSFYGLALSIKGVIYDFIREELKLS
jgi:hypothetical protein